MSSGRPGPVIRLLFRTPVWLYDRNLGWLLGKRFLCLTHVGRKSGIRYRTVLEVIGSKPAAGEIMVVAGLGPSSDWYRNIQANPAVEVILGRRRFPRRSTACSTKPKRSRWWRTMNGATAGSPWLSVDCSPHCSAGATTAARPPDTTWSASFRSWPSGRAPNQTRPLGDFAVSRARSERGGLSAGGFVRVDRPLQAVECRAQVLDSLPQFGGCRG